MNPYETPTHSGIDSEFPLEIFCGKILDAICFIPEVVCCFLMSCIIVAFMPIFSVVILRGLWRSCKMAIDYDTANTSVISVLLLPCNCIWYHGVLPLEIQICKWIITNWLS